MDQLPGKVSFYRNHMYIKSCPLANKKVNAGKYWGVYKATCESKHESPWVDMQITPHF